MLWASTSVEQQLNELVKSLDDYVSQLSAVSGMRHAEIAYCRSVSDYWRRQEFGFSWFGVKFSVSTYRSYVGGLVLPIITVFARQIYEWVVQLPYFTTGV